MSLKAVIIGGSNTVMAPGYMPALLHLLSRRGFDIDIVEDLAVGGTTSAFGLFQLKKTDILAGCDLLIIEYAINDSFIYGEERGPIRHWARFYEGIIRYALQQNPRLRIVSLIFGARNGSFIASVPSIDAGIHYISEWYGMPVINISRLLIQRYGREVVSHPTFYVDGGHYARPVATTIIANLIAEELEGCLQRPHSAGSLPPPIDPLNFSSASILGAGFLREKLGFSPIDYKNRRFCVSAANLGESRLRLEIDNGRPLALAYVCEPKIMPLEVSVANQATRCALLKGGVRDGTFKFLMSMLSCEFLYGSTLLQEPQHFSFCISAARAGVHYRDYLPKDNVSHQDACEGTPVVPVVGLLHTGKVRSCTAERV
jgi:hypothetical protein